MPAWLWMLMLATMAGTDMMDTGQFLTYLFVYALPTIIHFLVEESNPQKTTITVFLHLAKPPWLLRGYQRRKKIKRPKKPFVSSTGTKGNYSKQLRTYLLPLAMASFRVGCRIEIFLRRLRQPPPTLIALSSQTDTPDESYLHFDSDSYKIGVDNHASRCMVNSPHLFTDLQLIPQGKQVDGIGAGLKIEGVGTYEMSLEDDAGRKHKIQIPNSLYLPELRQCLLSPQHWAQEAKAKEKGKTWMENHWDKCVLLWGDGKFCKTVPHNPSTNTPIFHSAPSCTAYRAFATTFEALEAPFYRREQVLQVPGLRELRDPEEFVAEENIHLRDFPDTAKVREDDETIKTSNRTDSPAPPDAYKPSEHATRHGALTFDPSPPTAAEDDVPLAAADDQAELMRWHYRLGHVSFALLKKMAENGEIPKKLGKVTPPKCAGCLFGAMTKLPWRGKESKASHEVFVATKPGECVSVDQMVSTQVGFYAQLKGKLTNRRYRGATIFVDHYSRLRFIHLMQDSSSDETIKAKRAFEQFAADHGVKILHYHCDNGRFADNAFKQACEQSRQQLTFCGVNAHFQNGIAERAIRDLSESARKQLLHARARWPAAVHLALWPYALRNAALLFNTLPVLEDGTSRLELFSSIRVGSSMKNIHTFGCPVFALQNALASGNTIPKWSPRARMGLNLGPSPMHARNVYLVLSLSTGCVSPQYHCRFDDFFETTRHGTPDISDAVTWQQLAGLGRANEILSQVSSPILHSSNPGLSRSDSDNPSENLSVTQEENNADENAHYDTSVPTDTAETEDTPLPEGDAATPPPVPASTSLRGHVRTMS